MARVQGVCERPFFTGSSWETHISQVGPHPRRWHQLFMHSILPKYMLCSLSTAFFFFFLFKACCDCCTLGLKTNSMGFSCEFQDLELDMQCSNSAKVCCEKPKDTNPMAKGERLISRHLSYHFRPRRLALQQQDLDISTQFNLFSYFCHRM